MLKRLSAIGLLVPACVVTDAALAQTEEENQAQYLEVQQARTQMEQARRQLEEAARTIATQVQVLPDPGSDWGWDFSYSDGFNRGAGARIGASIVNAGNGALVTQVTPGRGAEEAGVEVGDVIQSIDGVDVTTGEETPVARVLARLREVEPGETVSVVVERAGGTLPFDVETAEGPGLVTTLVGPGQNGVRIFAPGDAPAQSVNLPSLKGRLADLGPGVDTLNWTFGFASSPWGDMELVAVSEGLGRYFETSEGLLVVSGPGNDAIDIRDGDVILAISGRTPNSPEHAIRILSSFESGETVEFSIMRDGRRQTVEYAVPEAQGNSINFRSLPVPTAE